MSKSVYILSFSMLLGIFSCNINQNASQHLNKKVSKHAMTTRNKILVPSFQPMIDGKDVNGAILIYDLSQQKYYSNNFKWVQEGKLPASTFKITNSLIGLETGIIKDEGEIFKWNGEKRALKVWEQDLSLEKAFHLSCIPCYQELARKIGVNRMNDYLDKFHYGKMVVNSSSIDQFWLQGNSQINQFQQIDFLTRFYQSQLPISDKTEEIMKKMMIIEKNKDFTLSGKTGWSVQNKKDNGWFVGYIETHKKVYFIAVNIEADQIFTNNSKAFSLTTTSAFARARKKIAYEALKQLNIIPKEFN